MNLQPGESVLGSITLSTEVTLYEKDGNLFRGGDDIGAVFNINATFPIIRTAQQNTKVCAPVEGSETLSGVIKDGICHEGAGVGSIVKFNEVGGIVVMNVTWVIYTAEVLQEYKKSLELGMGSQGKIGSIVDYVIDIGGAKKESSKNLYQYTLKATASYIISTDSIIVSDLDERVDMTCGIKESWGSPADLFMEKNAYTANLKATCKLINGKSINVKVLRQSDIQEGDVDKEIADILAEMDKKEKDEADKTEEKEKE